MTLKDVRPGLRAYLLADGAISAVVGARIYPVKLPQGMALTSIVYSLISGIGEHHLQGPSGLARPRFQIDCWAPLTPDAAQSLARLVKERIDGFRGVMPYGSNSPQDEIVVRGVFFDSERESYDDVTKLYGVSQDYFIWYAER